jgi:hypothetical protein
MRRKHANDHRASLLTISASSVKLLTKYATGYYSDDQQPCALMP